MRFLTFLLLGLALSIGILPAAARADAMAALKQYAAAMAAVHSYHTELTTEKNVMSMDLVLPDRMHIYGGSAGMEMIMIKPDFWFKVGGRWQKVPGNFGMIGAWTSLAESSRLPTDLDKDYTLVDLGIKETYHAYSLTPKKGGEVLTLYLRPDSLPAKSVVTGKNGTTTAVYSNFNNVTIDPPK